MLFGSGRGAGVMELLDVCVLYVLWSDLFVMFSFLSEEVNFWFGGKETDVCHNFDFPTGSFRLHKL